jgi:hypothetical protein
MKLTWRVAQETLRIDPPFFGNVRTTLEDVEFDGYRIPKGWQVLANFDSLFTTYFLHSKLVLFAGSVLN